MTARKDTPANRAALQAGIGATASQRGHIMGFWADEAGPMPGRVSLCTVCGMAGKYYFAEMKAVGGAVYLGCRTQKQM